MNTPTTRLKQVPLLLEPGKAEAMDGLSKRLDVPKQVLLREAVDFLLGKYGQHYASSELDAWRESLTVCFLRLAAARQIEMPKDADGACAEALTRIHAILIAWGTSKETLRSYNPNPPIGANSHKAKRAAKRAKQK